jgi:uncharacterized membrane protein
MTAVLLLTTIAMGAMLVMTLGISARPVTTPSNRPCGGADYAERLVAARYERGEITASDYRRILEVMLG